MPPPLCRPPCRAFSAVGRHRQPPLAADCGAREGEAGPSMVRQGSGRGCPGCDIASPPLLKIHYLQSRSTVRGVRQCTNESASSTPTPPPRANIHLRCANICGDRAAAVTEEWKIVTRRSRVCVSPMKKGLSHASSSHSFRSRVTCCRWVAVIRSVLPTEGRAALRLLVQGWRRGLRPPVACRWPALTQFMLAAILSEVTT